MRIWRGRHSAPLILIWAIALGLIAMVYKIGDVQPALVELLRPVYAIVLAVALLVTWKWFRTRTGGTRQDRRHADRRRTDRRDEE